MTPVCEGANDIPNVQLAVAGRLGPQGFEPAPLNTKSPLATIPLIAKGTV